MSNVDDLIGKILNDPRITTKVKEWIRPRQCWIDPKLGCPRTLDEVGTWQICGEDHNHGTALALLYGAYWEVLNAAVEMPEFFTYGHGGRLVFKGNGWLGSARDAGYTPANATRESNTMSSENNLIDKILNDPRITTNVKQWIGPRRTWINAALDSPRLIDTVGIWRVVNNNEACVDTSHQHNAVIAYLYGPYWEVLNMAVEWPGFFACNYDSKLVRTAGNDVQFDVTHTASVRTTTEKAMAKKLSSQASIMELSDEIRKAAAKLEDETKILRIEHELAFTALSSLPGGEHIVKALKLEATNRLKNSNSTSR